MSKIALINTRDVSFKHDQHLMLPDERKRVRFRLPRFGSKWPRRMRRSVKAHAAADDKLRANELHEMRTLADGIADGDDELTPMMMSIWQKFRLRK